MPDLLGMSRQAARDAAGPDAPPAPEIQPSTSMAKSALVFLENSVARKLAVAWPLCGDDEEQWPDAAGILSSELSDARRLMRALRLNGVCRDGGVLDTLAEQYIGALVAAPINRLTQRKPSADQKKR